MVRSVLAASAVALAFAAAGCANSNAPPASSLAQAGMAMAASDYVTQSAQSDVFEIKEGQLAMSKGDSPQVREFGRTMVADHTRTTQELMAAAAKSGIASAAPPPLSSDQQQMISELQGLSGKAFDRAYAAQQVQAHEDALAVQSAYADGGSDPNLKAFAIQTVPIIRRHLDMARQMQTALGG